MSSDESLFIKEYDEINQYVRSTCQLTMAWYTFFVTGNLIASGWLVAGGLKEDPTAPFYLIIVSLLFITVNGLSLRGFGKLIPYLKESDARLVELVNIVKKIKGPFYKKVKLPSPLPCSLYVELLRLYQWSLRAFFLFWVSLLTLNVMRVLTLS